MTLTRREFSLGTIAAATLLPAGVSSTEADKVMRRAIPSSGEMLPVIGLGTNRYGVDDSEAARAPLRETLARFRAWGGGMVDTAPMYRNSESVLGELISELGMRDDIFLATKTDRDNPASTEPQMRESMMKLRSDSIDLMQIHNLSGWKHAIPILDAWKKEGRIRYTGITTSRSSQYEELEMILKTYDFDFLQINYSLEQRESADRLLPMAADRGIGVVVNRAFGGGRLFRTLADQPVPDWAQAFGCDSWAQFLLKYALSHPAVTVVIPGMTKVRHVDDNFGAALGRMPDESERREMERFYDAL